MEKATLISERGLICLCRQRSTLSHCCDGGAPSSGNPL